MIVDHRTYSIKPGKLNDFLKVYGAEGFPLQMKYLGEDSLMTHLSAAHARKKTDTCIGKF